MSAAQFKNVISSGRGKNCILMLKDLLRGACTNCGHSHKSRKCDAHKENSKTGIEAAFFVIGLAGHLKGVEYLDVKLLNDLFAMNWVAASML